MTKVNQVIERAARAILEVRINRPDEDTAAYVDENWPAFSDEARAAVAALREIPSQFGDRHFFFDTGRDAWKDMIDAILSEPK